MLKNSNKIEDLVVSRPPKSGWGRNCWSASVSCGGGVVAIHSYNAAAGAKSVVVEMHLIIITVAAVGFLTLPSCEYC